MTAPSPWRRRISLWLPVVLWLGVIAVMSTDVASQTDTESSFLDFVRSWWPGVAAVLESAPWREAAGVAVRKAAHLSEYGILALLSLRAVRGGTRLRCRAAWGAVLLFCAVVASADELNQAMVASRSGSAVDVGIDLLGAALALTAVGLVRRRRGAERGPTE